MVADGRGNAAYIRRGRNDWVCALRDGTRAAFSYAGVTADEPALKAMLDRASTQAEVLALVRSSIGSGWRAELV